MLCVFCSRDGIFGHVLIHLTLINLVDEPVYKIYLTVGHLRSCLWLLKCVEMFVFFFFFSPNVQEIISQCETTLMSILYTGSFWSILPFFHPHTNQPSCLFLLYLYPSIYWCCNWKCKMYYEGHSGTHRWEAAAQRICLTIQRVCEILVFCLSKLSWLT